MGRVKRTVLLGATSAAPQDAKLTYSEYCFGLGVMSAQLHRMAKLRVIKNVAAVVGCEISDAARSMARLGLGALGAAPTRARRSRFTATGAPSGVTFPHDSTHDFNKFVRRKLRDATQTLRPQYKGGRRTSTSFCVCARTQFTPLSPAVAPRMRSGRCDNFPPVQRVLRGQAEQEGRSRTQEQAHGEKPVHLAAHTSAQALHHREHSPVL